jgi:hypothetical protein
MANKEQAVAALLAEPTIVAAARSLKISERTLRRWLEDPEFHSAYRAAKRAVHDDALDRLTAC